VAETGFLIFLWISRMITGESCPASLDFL